MKHLLQHTMRGFGQMWLSNSTRSGAMILLGILILSPLAALWSFLAALLTTSIVRWLDKSNVTAKTGLAGVNGVIIGTAWIVYPEVEWWMQAFLTILASIIMALLISPVTRWLKHLKSPLVLFSLPELLMVWLLISGLAVMGRYDWHHWSGWHALQQGKYEQARDQFTRAKPSTAWVEKWRHDGIGWTYFHQGKIASAKYYFEQCEELADAQCGLGWCHLKAGNYVVAEQCFLRGGNSPDAFEGLAWCQRLTGQGDGGFARVRWMTPLLAESWKPLHPRLAHWLDEHFSARAQRTSCRQLLCWLCFLVAIALHSRYSLIAVMITLSIDGLLGISDLALLYNQVPLMIALSGLYFRLSPATLIAIVLSNVILYLTWPIMSNWPSGSLMFNLLLLGGIAIFHRFSKTQLVPLELAMTSPERIRMGMQKIITAKECWRKIADAKNSDADF